MKKIIIACLIILAAGAFGWLLMSDQAEAAKVVFRRNVIFSAACPSSGTGYTYGDSNAYRVLVTAAGAGTNMKYLWNGSTSTDSRFIGGEQSKGGIDDCGWDGSQSKCTMTDPSDWVGGKPYGTSTAGWTTCNDSDYDPDSNPGGNRCNTGVAGADAEDNSTGLVWSFSCNGSGCSSLSDSSPLTYSWGSLGANNGGKTSSELCSSGLHGQSGWYLPHQKQLMQAYINGSYGHLESLGTGRDYWSATSVSSGLTFAWYTGLSYGNTSYGSKTTGTYSVRCVRSAI